MFLMAQARHRLARGKRPGPEGWISSNVAGIAVSAIKEMSILSARVPDVASLAWGLPSFRTPQNIRRVIQDALDKDPDIGKYTLPDGLPELRAAVAEEHRRSTGVTVDADRQVMISAGNMQALNAVLHAILDRDDEIILTDPGFASHFLQVRLCGGKPVSWPLNESRGWALDADALPGLITGKTKAILLVSPSNPTGSVFEEEELRQVVDIAAEHDLLVLLDDPYSFLTYEGDGKCFNLAAVDAHRERIVYCFTFSKSFAMSGWRVGYMILPEPIKKQVMKVHDATIICTPRISQVAALAALQGDREPMHEFKRVLDDRRRLICERLDRVDHAFDYVRPRGAYYVFPRILAEHEDSVEFSMRLLEEAKVTVTPGAAFGEQGEHHVRMAYCVAEDVINTAFDRIEAYFPRREF
jgi:aspartate/methionine/tyrosine aminotransferase